MPIREQLAHLIASRSKKEVMERPSSNYEKCLLPPKNYRSSKATSPKLITFKQKDNYDFLREKFAMSKEFLLKREQARRILVKATVESMLEAKIKAISNDNRRQAIFTRNSAIKSLNIKDELLDNQIKEIKEFPTGGIRTSYIKSMIEDNLNWEKKKGEIMKGNQMEEEDDKYKEKKEDFVTWEFSRKLDDINTMKQKIEQHYQSASALISKYEAT